MMGKSIFNYFFGNDVFISYRWSDTSKKYALRLTEELEKRGLSCFIDERGLSGGEVVPNSLNAAIRRSKMFVLIAADDLDASTWVPKEIAIAESYGRKIVPINVAKTLEKLNLEEDRWLPLKDRSRIEETDEAFLQTRPSPLVSEKIDQAYTFTRQRVNSIRILFIIGLIFFALSLIAGGTAVYAVRIRQQAEQDTSRLNEQAEQLKTQISQAQEEKRKADEDAEQARTERQSALKEKKDAQDEADSARIDTKKAQTETTAARSETKKAQTETSQAVKARSQAESEAKTARTEKVSAEKDRDLAKADAEAQTQIAERQKVIADEQREEAEKQALLAETNEKTARRFLYTGHINGAQQALDAENFIYADDLLKNYVQPDKEDLRGFEWFYLWRTGHRKLATIELQSKILSLAFAPDNSTLATANADGIVKLWDVKLRKEIKTLTGHKGKINNIIFSNDGQTFATAGDDGTVKLWDREKELISFNNHSGAVNSVAFSAENDLVASAGQDGTVRLWSVKEQRQIFTFTGFPEKLFEDSLYKNGVKVVAFSPDGKKLAAGDESGKIKLWDITSRRELITFDAGSRITSITFTEDGNKLVTTYYSSYQSYVSVWDLYFVESDESTLKNLGMSKKELEELVFQPSLGTTEKFTSPWLSPDGRTLLLENTLGKVETYNVFAGEKKEPYKWLADELSNSVELAFSPDKNSFVTTRDGKLEFWDTKSIPEFSAINTGHATSVTFTPDGKSIWVGEISFDYDIDKYDVNTRQQTDTLKGYYSDFIIHASDGKQMVLVGNDLKIKMLDPITLEVKRELKSSHDLAIWGMALSSDGKWLTAGGLNKKVFLWDLTVNEEPVTILDLPDEIRSLSISPDNNILAVGVDDGIVRLWDLKENKEIQTLGEKGFHLFNVLFSPDGKVLATSSYDQTIKLWNTETWSLVKTLRGHTDMVKAIAFTHDGKTLASGSGDGIIKLWSMNTGLELATLKKHKENEGMYSQNDVNSLAFSPDDKILASASNDRTVQLWYGADNIENSE